MRLRESQSNEINSCSSVFLSRNGTRLFFVFSSLFQPNEWTREICWVSHLSVDRCWQFVRNMFVEWKRKPFNRSMTKVCSVWAHIAKKCLAEWLLFFVRRLLVMSGRSASWDFWTSLNVYFIIVHYSLADYPLQHLNKKLNRQRWQIDDNWTWM